MTVAVLSRHRTTAKSKSIRRAFKAKHCAYFLFMGTIILLPESELTQIVEEMIAIIVFQKYSDDIFRHKHGVLSPIEALLVTDTTHNLLCAVSVTFNPTRHINQLRKRAHILANDVQILVEEHDLKQEVNIFIVPVD